MYSLLHSYALESILKKKKENKKLFPFDYPPISRILLKKVCNNSQNFLYLQGEY